MAGRFTAGLVRGSGTAASLAILLAWPVLVSAAPAAAPAQQQTSDGNLLLLETRVDQYVVSDGLSAYQSGNAILLPLGELARLLTIAIRSQPAQGTASGYVLKEERGFSLDLARALVTLGDKTEPLDTARVEVEADDLYVDSRLLARWLPVDLDIDLSTMSLRVHPRETLPLQLRFDRESRRKQAGPRAGYVNPGYPRLDTPYQLMGMPVVDQTLGLDVRRAAGSHGNANATYTAYVAGDLLAMESSLFVNSSRQKPTPDLRFTLARHDPDASLLGALHARSFEIGSVPVPGVPNIALNSASGTGVTLSNRPLTQPTSFDRHSLQGNLPPGWDVELYFNEALVGFQQSRPDGKYSFDNQPLIFGPNEFRLVFHGPLGQARVERQSFLLEQSLTAPGEFYYNFAQQRDKAGNSRTTAQFDVGLTDSLSATGGMARLPVAGQDQRYVNLGLRAFWQSFIVSADLARAQTGGSLGALGLRTRIGGVSIDASRAYLHDFTSDLFLAGGDSVRIRDRLRIDGIIPFDFMARVPIALEAKRTQLQSGAVNDELAGRISTFRYGTAISNSLRWQATGAQGSADDTLQVSRRIAGIGISGQLIYGLKPAASLVSAAISADKSLAAGYLLNLGVARSFASDETVLSAGLSKVLGRYGLGVNASYSTRGAMAFGVQLFTSIGREPRRSTWFYDAQPMANSGAASIRLFVDKNLNGVMDAGEEPIKGASFTVNGGTHQIHTDEAGIAHLTHLPTRQGVDIAVDAGSLEDPQWVAQKKGARIVPRPGTVAQFDFPIITTGEIDGTVYLLENGAKHAIGDVALELLDARHKVIGEAKSAADGYYIVPAVAPGDYLLRPSAEQLKRLKLTDTGMRIVTIGPDGTFVNGVDFTLIPAWEPN